MTALARGRFALVALGLALPCGAAAGPWRGGFEIGLEGDTNVTRALPGEGEGRVAAVLFRALAELAKAGKVGEHLRWSADGRLGARGVAVVSSENILTIAASLAVERDGPAGTTVLGRASHYDARALEDGPERRDFATSGVDLGLRLPADGDRVAEVEVGLRRLTYRRDADFDWSGALLAVELRDQLWNCRDLRTIDLTARYQVERRAYTGLAFTRVACPAGANAAGVCVRPTEEHRADLRHTADAELLYTGEQILSARYRLIVNDSSSFGSSLYRHRLDLSATVGLPRKVFATATLTGQLDHFPEPYLAHIDDLDQPVDSIDDENRSGAALRLARALSAHWQVEARGAVFADLFPREGRGFHREVVYLGLTWDDGD